MDDLVDASGSFTAPQPLAPPPNDLRRLIVWTAIPATIAAILGVAHLIRPYGRPSRTVAKVIDALQSGDADRLRTEERLGLKHRAELEVKARGEGEYARLMGLFDKEALLGDREYRRIRRKVADLGDKDFRKLNKDQQRTLREAGRRAFVADKGWAALAEEDRAIIGSAETLGDRLKIRKRAIELGLPTLADDLQLLAAGTDLTTPEAAKDKKLAKIASAAEKAGMQDLLPALQQAEAAAMVELNKLSRKEREKIESTPFAKWVLEQGLKAADDKLKAKANLEQLLDDDGAAAWALRRSFGQKDLDAESKKALEGVDFDKLVDGKRAFVEAQGARLWGQKLKEMFNADCCSTTKVRYLGESGRSLVRNASATVTLEYGALPPKVEKKKTDADKPAERTIQGKTVVAEEFDDGVHPAKKYLGTTVQLEYRWGSWQIAGFDRHDLDADGEAQKRPEDAMKQAMGALTMFGSTVSGFVLFGVIGIVLMVVVILRRKDRPALSTLELSAAAVVLVLAALQIAFEGQASLDDFFFTPVYLALPIWVGARRGSESGIVAGFLAGLGLVIASAVAGVPSWASAGGNGLPLGEHLLATLFLAGTGAIAGRLKWPSELPVMLPIVWLLFFAIIDRSQLASLTCYAHVLFAAAVVGIGTIVDQLGVLRPLARVTDPDAATA